MFAGCDSPYAMDWPLNGALGRHVLRSPWYWDTEPLLSQVEMAGCYAGNKKPRPQNFSPHHTTKLTIKFRRTMKPEDHHQHHDIPTKAKVQGAIEFCERMNLFYYKNDVFRTFMFQKHVNIRCFSLTALHVDAITILSTKKLAVESH